MQVVCRHGVQPGRIPEEKDPGRGPGSGTVAEGRARGMAARVNAAGR